MTSFHRPGYESTAKDHPKHKKVKEFARCIERLYSTEPTRRFDYRGIYRKEEDLNREILMREILMRDDTRYLRDHFRCTECYRIGLHPNK